MVDFVAPVSLVPFLDRARSYAQDARAPATHRAYRSDWSTFAEWCRALDVSALPADPEVVAAYFADLAEHGKRIATITRALASIADRHRTSGFDSPRSAAAVVATLRGIKRRHGVAPVRKTALVIEDVDDIVRSMNTTPACIRDRAILLLGFAGAFRRSELVAIDIEDIAFEGRFLQVTIRRSKTDSYGKGRTITIQPREATDCCPVRATAEWLTLLPADGPLFRRISRSGRPEPRRLAAGSISRLVKLYVRTTGVNPASYAGHSLRRGFVTSAFRAGSTDHAIAKQTGHKDLNQLKVYIESR